MAIENSTLDSFVDAIKQDTKTKDHIYQATVSRVDKEGVVYVNLPGSDQDTPTELSAAEVNRGDAVNVEWRNNKLYIAGNTSNPAAGVQKVAIVEAIADVAKAQAARANQAAIEAEASAADAKATAEGVETIAEEARGNANAAEASATSAANSATLSLNQLSIIENVVGVLDLLSKNGEYQQTADTEVTPNKWYFNRVGTSPNYTYQVVSNPTGDPSAQGFYELTGIDQAVQNYVSSHLALDDNGLWLQADSSNAKLYLSSTDGVVLYGTGGIPVAKYGTDTYIGDYTSANGYYIKLDSVNNEIGFYQGNNKVAYMNGAQLYVANSLSFGHFVFYERSNGHFTLKRIS